MKLAIYIGHLHLLCLRHLKSLESYIDKGTFPSKFKWKKIIKLALYKNESLERSDRLGAEQVFSLYLMHRVDVLTRMPV